MLTISIYYPWTVKIHPIIYNLDKSLPMSSPKFNHMLSINNFNCLKIYVLYKFRLHVIAVYLEINTTE